MEKFKKFAAPAIGAFALLLILFICKSSPVSKLWKGYVTLSVPVQTDASLVGDVLEEAGCEGCISLEGQEAQDADDGYSERKFLYFFDRDKAARIYYIPDAFASQASSAARLLQARFHVDAAIGSRASFPFLTLLVCVAAFLALLRSAENKSVYSLASFPALFYAFCNPFCAAAAAVCLELYSLYLGQRLWRRKGALPALVSNSVAVAFAAAALLLSLAAGFSRGLFFLLNLAAAFSLLFLLFNIQAEQDKRARFLPVLIRSAGSVNSVNVKTLKKAFFVSAEIFVLFALLCAGTDFLSSGGKKGLFFPAPTEYNGKASEFPLMEDYFVHKWNLAVFQYRSLNKDYPKVPQEGERVEMTHYEKTKDGIKARKELALAYNAAFRKEASDALEKTESPAVEKLWKAQGKKFSVAYKSGGTEEAGFGLAAALLLAALLPLFCALAPRLKFKMETLAYAA